jgi:hypothetical protein
MPMRPPGPGAVGRAYTAGTLLVGLCSVGTLTLLATAPLSGHHAIVAPGASAPNGSTPGPSPSHVAPPPEFPPLPGPGPG